jgi:hypothetical protein
MKATNPNSNKWLNYWWRNASMVPKILLSMCFYFWCVLLFCRLWWREFGELVHEMECNLNCSMKTFHELCESCFYKEIGRMISWKRGDEVMRSIFDVGWENEGRLFGCCNPTFGRVWRWHSHFWNGDLGVLRDSQNFGVRL